MPHNKRRKIMVLETIAQHDTSSSSDEESEFDQLVSDDSSTHSWLHDLGFEEFQGADELSENEFVIGHRVKRSTFDVILKLLEAQLSEPSRNRHGRAMHQDPEETPEKILMFALSSMTTAWPSSHMGADDCGISNQTGWRLIGKVVNALNTHINTFIKWPDQARAAEISRHFEERYKLAKVIGALCETTVKVDESPLNIYSDRKRSMKLRIICDHKSIITHANAGQIGLIQNLKIFRNAGFEKVFPQPKRLKYAEHDHFVGNDNTRLSKSGPISDLTLELLRKRFPSLKNELPQCRVNIKKYIYACCVLHNICEMHNDRIIDEFAYTGA